ncbi:MAG: M20 family metallopeptidase [Microbacteriaceae bacterium]
MTTAETHTEIGERAVELLRELVSIDSVNPALVDGAAGESAIVAFLQHRLGRAGFTTHVVCPPDRPDRPSLVAIAPRPLGAPTVIFNGHLDTVGVKGMDAPFTPRIEGDKLFARGAADMKGGVAALVAAAEELVHAGAPVRPVLALVADEEDSSLGSEAVIAALPELGIQPDVCLIGEPTDNALARSLRGFAVVKVTFAGRASHSSQPENGINAVTHLGEFMARVAARAETVRSTGGDLMITMVCGGDSPYVIPEHAECLVEVRTVAGQLAAQAAQDIATMFDASWDALTEVVVCREAWQLDGTGPAADLAVQLGSVLGTAATFDAPYWMEAPLWQEVCPTLICGPSGGGLHAVDEWVDLRQVRVFAQALAEATASPSLFT